MAKRSRALVVVAAAAFLVVTTTASAWRGAHPLPYWDAWGFVDDLASWHAGTYGVADLFRPANEHRIALPRLLFFVDWLWFAGREKSLIAAALLMLALLSALVAWLTVDGSTMSPAARVAAAAATTATLWSGTQIACLGWSFSVQFMAQSLLPAVALAALLRARPRSRDVAVALASATGATFAIASSLLLWPVLLTIACVRPIGMAVRGAIAGAGAACWAIYLGPGGLPIGATSSLVEHGWRSVAWSLTHLGSAWQLGALASLAAGLAGWLLLIGAAARQGVRRDPHARTLIAIAALWALYSLAIGHGRHDLGREEALADRYAPGPLLFWAALLGAHLRQATPPGRRWCATVAAVLIALLLHKQVKSCRRWRNVAEARTLASLSFWLGDLDPRRCAEIGVRPQDLHVWLPVLRAHRVSIFAGTVANLPGQTITPAFSISPQLTDVAFTRLPHERAGSPLRELAGTLPRDATQVGTMLAAVDRDGRVCGLGSIGWDLTRNQRALAPAGGRRWFALVPANHDPTDLRWFLLDPDAGVARPLPPLPP